MDTLTTGRGDNRPTLPTKYLLLATNKDLPLPRSGAARRCTVWRLIYVKGGSEGPA